MREKNSNGDYSDCVTAANKEFSFDLLSQVKFPDIATGVFLIVVIEFNSLQTFLKNEK